jgi:hypothetical protein
MFKSTIDAAFTRPRASHSAAAALLRAVVIVLTAFLTVVDLFATQAILPSLVKAYGVSPAAMGVAVNASTIGMAIAGLAVAFFSSRINRRLGVLLSLALVDPNRSSRSGARPDDIHRAQNRARLVYVVGLYPDARLSR